MKYFFSILFSYFLFWGSAQNEDWDLQRCIDYATENNLNVISSRINEALNKTQEESAKSQQLPSVNGNFNNALNFGFQRTPLGLFEYSQSYTNGLSLDANMIIYNRKKLHHQIQQSEINSDIQEYNTQSIIQDISLQIASMYLQIILNHELERIAQNQVDNSKEQLRKTRVLYEAGSIPYSNLVEQEAKFASDNSQLQTSKINVDRALFNLAIFLQLEDYKDFSIEMVELPEILEVEDLSVNDVVDIAYSLRPEIKQAELQIEAAEKDIDIAETAAWPLVRGGYSIGTNYYDFFDSKNDNMFKQWYDNHNQQVYVGVQIPIFNKINKYNVTQAKQNKDLVSQNIEQQKLSLRQDIQTAFFDAQAAFEQYLNLKKAFESAKVSEEFGQKSYDAGKISIYDFNILRTNTMVAESQMVNAKFDYFFKLKVIDFYAGRPIVLDY